MVTVNENTSGVTMVTATDADLSDTLSYSIVGGADAARFGINASTGGLVFLVAPDHEAPVDADANNVYEVQVAVNDGVHQVMQQLAVTVADVLEQAAPTPGVDVPAPSLPTTSNQPTQPVGPTEPTEQPRTETPAATEPPPQDEADAGGGEESPGASSEGEALLGTPQPLGDELGAPVADGALPTAAGAGTLAAVSPSEYRLTWQGIAFEPDAWLVSTPVQVLVQTLETVVGAVEALAPSSAAVPQDLGLGDITAWPPASGELSVALDVQTVQLGGVALSAGAVWWAVRTSGLLASMAVSAPAWRGIDPLPILSREREALDPDADADEFGAQAEAMFDGLRRDDAVADIEPV